jgi:hypothetical protein
VQHLAVEFVNVNEGGQQVKGKYMATRLEPAPASAHRISGVWRPGKLEGLSENAMDVTYKATGDTLSMSDNAGNSYTAPDGKVLSASYQDKVRDVEVKWTADKR